MEPGAEWILLFVRCGVTTPEYTALNGISTWLQFPSDVFNDDSAVATLERDLIEVLGDDAYVDGVDLGHTEISVFISLRIRRSLFAA